MTTENTTPVKPVTAPAKAVAKKPAKTLVKAAPKAIAKPETKAVAKPKARPSAKATAKPAATKEVKVKKPKMVRDSFTFPKAEYAVLDALKLRAAQLGSPAKKTELLRAGVKALSALQDTAFLAALKAVPSLKTGRPAKDKAA